MPRKRVERNIAYDDQKHRYYVTFRYAVGCGGRKKRRTQTYLTHQEAAEALRRFELQTQNGAAPQMGFTLESWLQFWLEDVVTPNRAASTIHGYANMIHRHLIPAMGATRLDRLSPIQLQHYYAAKLKEGLSANTVRKHHHLLLAALELAVRQGQLEHNPAQSVTPPTPVAPKHTYYNSIQLHHLFELTTGTQLELVVRLAGFLGLRRSEICGLRWDHVDLGKNVIEVCSVRTSVGGMVVEKGTKTDASCRKLDFSDIPELKIPLQREFHRQKSREEGYNPGNYVVVRKDGMPYQPDYLSNCLRQFVSLHALPPVTLHGLRHSFASIANSSNIPMFDIGKAMGHSSASATSRIYTHLFDLTHRDAICAVGMALRIQDREIVPIEESM